MTTQPYRLGKGGRIDRSRLLSFSFDGRSYAGFLGDTLASALLANGVRLVGRSMKYHRSRGIIAAGVEEPNALVTLGTGDRREPNVPATTIELFDGLVAASQNAWPSLRFDLLSVIDRFSGPFSAGFYYKSFMGPTRRAWMLYEKLIRKTAGLGHAPITADPDRYEKSHAFCDVLVVGGGPSGLAAALAAGRSGARVVLVEDAPRLGGALLDRAPGCPTDAWLERISVALDALPNVRVMARTTAFGAYDNGVFGLIERVSDHLARPEPYQPRQRFWILRTRQAILATGMVERPLVFGNNDLPGVMLASAARSYVNRYAVSLGRAVVVFTTNDSAYEAALACAGAGAKVYVVDVRPDVPADLRRTAQEAGIALYLGCAVATAHGRARVRSVDVVDYFVAQGKSGALRGRLACDGLLVSGGWTPTLQLLGQRGCKPTYDDELATFVAKQVPDGYRLTGGAAGVLRLDRSVEHAWETGQLAAQACDLTAAPPEPSLLDGLSSEGKSGPLAPVWSIADADSSGRKKKFIDFQHDVTLGDISQALQEGYDTVDHLKRYTTLGMATDQGKTSNVNALGIVAEMLQLPLNAIGTTTFRPPFRPIAIGALAGSEFGPHFKPVRRSPMHDWHERHGAVFTDTGLWRRPWYYPKPGESVREASAREAGGVRQFLGIVDISSLGKIDVQGPDAVHFLDRVYVNGWATLPVGKARYGVMLRADGIVLDDGTTSRLSEQHYFMTSTTSGAGKVMTHLEYLLQTAWPELKVHVTSVTSQWAAIAVAGPRSRDLLSRLVADCDFRSAAFPFMGVRNGTLGGLPVRILRVSFSGELAYELYTPAGYGEQLWTALWEAGQAMGIGAYGTEALGMLRIEKGHVAGAEIDGRTTLADLGLGDMASKKKPYIGSALARRDALVDPQRPQLVGLEPSAPGARLRAGAILCEPGRHTGHGIGFVSSVTYSSELGRHIGLGFVAGGMARQGDAIDAVFALRNEVTAVRVTSPRFVDPREERLHA